MSPQIPSFWFIIVFFVALSAGLGWWIYHLYKNLATLDYQLARMQRALSGHETNLERAKIERESLGDVATSALFVLDNERRVLWLNEQAREAASAFDVVGRVLIEALPSYDITQTLDDALERGTLSERQITFKARLWRVRARPAGGNGSVLALDDVTELQRLGRARREFVANISHDLRTPIAAIQLTIDTLRNSALSDAELAQRLIENMATQTDALQQLATELFDLSQIESGQVLLKLIPTPLAEVVEPVMERLRPQAERKSLQLQLALSDAPPILVDTEQTQKIVANLLHNAIKFTPSGRVIGVDSIELVTQDGKIRWIQTASSAMKHVPNHFPDDLPDGRWLLICVWDQGPGIAASELPRIFERFYKGDRSRARTNETGAGLGLSIARHIVLGHGGQIWVESAQAEGARFYFTLPVA